MTFLPNALTVARIAMIPAFIWQFVSSPDSTGAALIIFAAAMLTDALDGFLARSLNCVSRFGTLVDPLADKLMTLAALACLAWFNRLSPAAPAIVAAKDAFLVAGACYIYKNGIIISAGLPGKLATLMLTASISALMIPGLPSWAARAAEYLTYASIAASVFAAWYYARIAVKRVKQPVKISGGNIRD